MLCARLPGLIGGEITFFFLLVHYRCAMMVARELNCDTSMLYRGKEFVAVNSVNSLPVGTTENSNEMSLPFKPLFECSYFALPVLR